MVLIAGQTLDPFPLGLDQSSAEDRCAQWKFISVCVSCSQRERRKEPSMKGKRADWKAGLSLPSRLQGSRVCDTNTCSSFRTEALPPEARPPPPGQASRCLVRALAAAPTVPTTVPRAQDADASQQRRTLGGFYSEGTGHWNWRGGLSPLSQLQSERCCLVTILPSLGALGQQGVIAEM